MNPAEKRAHRLKLEERLRILTSSISYYKAMDRDSERLIGLALDELKAAELKYLKRVEQIEGAGAMAESMERDLAQARKSLKRLDNAPALDRMAEIRRFMKENQDAI